MQHKIIPKIEMRIRERTSSSPPFQIIFCTPIPIHNADMVNKHFAIPDLLSYSPSDVLIVIPNTIFYIVKQEL